MNSPRPSSLPFFVRGDLDGFFGLLIDNLVNLMLIVSLCTGLLGMPAALVFGRILPGRRSRSGSGTCFTRGRPAASPGGWAGMI